MKPIVVMSNMFNEIDQLPTWFEWVKKIADGGILIVDTGSDDGTIEYARAEGAIVLVDDIIRREGYGPARTHLRDMAKHHFPRAHWGVYFDADESINESEFHILRWMADYLSDEFDVIALPRIDWHDRAMTKAENDFRYAPDWQARMTRLYSDIQYIRRLHEQVVTHKKIYTDLQAPKINHFHRSAGQEKRDRIGKLCAFLHEKDELGHTYPAHKKEAEYLEKFKKEGF